MKLIVQRVTRAAVTIDGNGRREIGAGLVLLAGFCGSDTEEICEFIAQKTVHLRIFDDENGHMNRSLLDVGGACLLVSQFTLYANCRKGRRPSFVDAAPPEQSEPLYRHWIQAMQQAAGADNIRTGEFGADMQVELVNDGPVTIILDSAELGFDA